jgi:hypothetical protein
VSDLTWAQSRDKVMRLGMEEAMKGSYSPRSEYTDKATFEARGLKKWDGLSAHTISLSFGNSVLN